MANELGNSSSTGKTVYYLIRNSVNQIWNGASFEAYLTAHYATYVVAATEQGTASGFYTANMPGAVTGIYAIIAKQQVGGSPAETDTDVGTGNAYWDGTNLVMISLPTNMSSLSISTSGRIEVQSGYTKNTAYNNFSILMVSSTDHVTPKTGLTVASQRSIDGGAFVNTTNSVTELGSGVYLLNLSAADLNGDSIMLKFSAANADTRFISIRTTP
jgi:hypothetical protein